MRTPDTPPPNKRGNYLVTYSMVQAGRNAHVGKPVSGIYQVWAETAEHARMAFTKTARARESLHFEVEGVFKRELPV